MAHYIVRARPIQELLPELQELLASGEIDVMRPFGGSLQYSLENARRQDKDWAIWEEEDYCTPPLAQERAAVLDRYFTDLTVQNVSRGEGWEQLEELPPLWDRPQAER
ncbi:MAG: hypothetical protein O6949_11700 [Chloroflexi bacterium]|nr:hypothetical protein [Chloroflexota bacterium]